jgi:hypothetical protein
MERRFFLLAWGVLAVAAVCAAQPADVHLNCTAVGETGEVLAKGAFRIGRKDRILYAPRCDTRGQSPEPAPMHMLFSYVLVPTDRILFLPPTPEGVWVQRIGNQEDRKGRVQTVLDGNEPISVPAGTFREARKYRTTVSDAQGDSEQAIDFVNGVRYMWIRSPGASSTRSCLSSRVRSTPGRSKTASGCSARERVVVLSSGKPAFDGVFWEAVDARGPVSTSNS